MGALKSTRCSKGHLLKDAYVCKNGKRECRQCSKQRARKYYQKHSARNKS